MATTLMPQLPKEFLTAARKGQEYALDAMRTWVQTVQSVIPGIPTVQIPFANRLPKPEAILTSAYDFAGQLLASQRHFAEELLKATEPLMPAIGTTSTAPEATDAPASTPRTASTPSTPRTASTPRTTRTAPKAPATHRQATHKPAQHNQFAHPPPPLVHRQVVNVAPHTENGRRCSTHYLPRPPRRRHFHPTHQLHLTSHTSRGPDDGPAANGSIVEG
jgi:hypothetical protein